jgi:hypothetical protein
LEHDPADSNVSVGDDASNREDLMHRMLLLPSALLATIVVVLSGRAGAGYVQGISRMISVRP